MAVLGHAKQSINPDLLLTLDMGIFIPPKTWLTR
jgi:hypothetical protein